MQWSLGHSSIIHCFSSLACLLWGNPTSLFTSAELVHTLYLKSRGNLCVRCLLHTTFSVVYLIEFRGQYGLHVFDVQRAEQDSGVLECNRSARRVQEMPSTLKFTQMQCRKCCNNCFDVYKLLMSNDIDHPPASWSIYCGDEKQWIILEWPYTP